MIILTKAAAEYLKISTTTLNKLRRQGLIKAMYYGCNSMIRYDTADLDDFMARSKLTYDEFQERMVR